MGSKYSNIGYVLLGTFCFTFLLLILRITSISFKFSFLEIGKIIGPIPSLIILPLIPGVILYLALRKLNLNLNFNKKLFSKIKTKKGIKLIATSLSLSLLITLLFSVIYFPLVIQTREKLVNPFIVQTKEQNLTDVATHISSFLGTNLKSSYKVHQALFEIDEDLFTTLLDPQLLQFWGISRADIILYQGWGSCGQAAILIEELLYKLGYESRRATFIGIDHAWAEVKNDEEWLIVDPWYIGNLIQIQDLKTLKPEFEKASGVKVLYKNGTSLDMSKEHGY